MPEGSQLIDVDPTELVIGTNVRLDPTLDRSFIASIRERGVLEPIVAHRSDSGSLVVKMGNRRTLAAVKTSRRTVPVYVIAPGEEADRLIDQMAENDHRQGLTPVDRLRGFEMLEALGLTAGQIAKRTATPRAQVNAGLRAAKSEAAIAAAAMNPMVPLDQLATIAEFEDSPDTIEHLTRFLGDERFDHLAQRARDDRSQKQLIKDFTQSLVEGGVVVIGAPSYTDNSVKRLIELRPAGSEEEFTPDAHADCPGHAAIVTISWISERQSAATDANGHLSGGDQEDDGYDDEDGDPVSAPSGHYGPIATYVCTDAGKYGHQPRWGAITRKAADMAPEEREQARADRRDVIQSNKDWRSAETVRRRWLTEFATRSKPPVGAEVFIASCLTAADHPINSVLSTVSTLAYELFGIPEADRPTYANRTTPITDLAGGASPARATVITLGVLVSAYESVTSVQSYRHMSDSTARYLRFIESAGYTLSEVELRACGAVTAKATLA
jgi:ParB family chromosome partitioning protein